jgi:cell division protease FtsH
VALGGRVAEELVFGTHTTGAESDLEQITEIARRMVARWGMSQAIGPMVTQGSGADGPLLPGVSDASPDTQRLVDEEVRRILTDAHRDVTELLRQHRDQLDDLAHALLEHETLDGIAAYRAAGQSPPPDPNARALGRARTEALPADATGEDAQERTPRAAR